MYWNEAHHARPHFHARYGGQAASIDLDGNVIAGFLPRRAQRSLPSGHACTDPEPLYEEARRNLVESASSAREPGATTSAG
jgi:hypothetical protein